jgi:hypothetical protein
MKIPTNTNPIQLNHFTIFPDILLPLLFLHTTRPRKPRHRAPPGETCEAMPNKASNGEGDDAEVEEVEGEERRGQGKQNIPP